MASDPTLPARLAALGFRPCECIMCAGWGTHVVLPGEDPNCSACDGTGMVACTAEAMAEPEAEDAALRFLADRLAGKRVPLPEGWRWVDPVIGTPYLRNRADDKILSDDCDGWTLKRCEPPEIGAWLIAKGHANAGVRMRGMAQSVADLEQLSATRGASTAGTESETP